MWERVKEGLNMLDLVKEGDWASLSFIFFIYSVWINRLRCSAVKPIDMNQETSIIQCTSMKIWKKYCWNYQKMFQFMPHWRRMKFDCYKFWVGYSLE